MSFSIEGKETLLLPEHCLAGHWAVTQFSTQRSLHLGYRSLPLLMFRIVALESGIPPKETEWCGDVGTQYEQVAER